ncbi:MAG: rhodanese-like domain-containing protein [Acidithiobacillus caldus]|nr:rhodanese-like domain-containing protein [Acidithiobacillus caldus]
MTSKKSLADFIHAARAEVPEVDCETVQGWFEMGDDVLVVDVRQREDYEAGRLPGAVHAPRDHLEALADPNYLRCHPELARAHNRRVLLYCDSVTRSLLAARTLKDMGFVEVYNLSGGYHVWEAEDLPTHAGPPAAPSVG